MCLDSGDTGKVYISYRNRNDQGQLWDRRGSNIVRAHTNQCPDSNSAGQVYWMECNGGRYHQMWDFRSDESVVNVATVKWLNAHHDCNTSPSSCLVLETTDTPYGWEHGTTHWWFGFPSNSRSLTLCGDGSGPCPVFGRCWRIHCGRVGGRGNVTLAAQVSHSRGHTP
ncbi:hypothetical protein [Streptomyces sp. NBC_01384]|uniref:hypothetical protein n=1 Tax=Streptomyces sp. NBC_01384 TaxID=2903847 RepID=UPI0038635594